MKIKLADLTTLLLQTLARFETVEISNVSMDVSNEEIKVEDAVCKCISCEKFVMSDQSYKNFVTFVQTSIPSVKEIKLGSGLTNEQKIFLAQFTSESLSIKISAFSFDSSRCDGYLRVEEDDMVLRMETGDDNKTCMLKPKIEANSIQTIKILFEKSEEAASLIGVGKSNVEV